MAHAMDEDPEAPPQGYTTLSANSPGKSSLSANSPGNGSADPEFVGMWKMLEMKSLLSPCYCIWFRIMLEMWISPAFGSLVAVACVYLVVAPDEAMCEYYGQRLTRAICMVAALTSAVEVLQVVRVKAVLHSPELKRAFEQQGDAVIVHTWMSSLRIPWHQQALWLLAKTLAWVAGMLAVVQFWRGASFLTCAVAIALSIHRATMLEANWFLREFAKALSTAMVDQFRDHIQDFPTDTPHPDDDFWEKAIDLYKDMDILLEQLWKSAILVYLPYYANRVILISSAVILCVEAVCVSDWATPLACIAVVILDSRALLTSVAELASITESCISRSLASDSIVATAIKKLGTNRMTDKQKHSHLVFTHCLQVSPAGVQMGTLVDGKLAFRLGVSLLTGTVSFISYTLTKMDIDIAE